MKYVVALFLWGLIACDPQRDEPHAMMGYVPVYISAQNATTIGTAPARPTTFSGKIYAYGNYLFQVEQNEGIHIIDNSIPQQAHKIFFLKVPTCSELAIRNNYLYTNNLKDLLVFDLSNLPSPQLVKRLTNAFPGSNQAYPDVAGAYFECPDPKKGVVIAWKLEMIRDPKCRR